MAMTRRIDMESETFTDLRHQMTEIINSVITNMQETGADVGKVAVTIKIGLEETMMDENGVKRPVTLPTFKHKVTSAVQIKNERTGQLPGGSELVKGMGGVYELHQIATPLEEMAEYEGG